MSHKARDVLLEIVGVTSKIDSLLYDLSEADLKAIAAELSNMINADGPEEREVLGGILARIEWDLSVRKAERTNKGQWFAIATLTRWDQTHSTAELDEIEAVECKSKTEAIKTARELLRKHAGMFDEHVSVEVEIEAGIVRARSNHSSH